MTKSPKRPPAGLPDKDTLIAFLREAGSAEKTDIARHFGLKGGDRRALREMIRELEAEGKLGKRGRKGFSEAGALPPVGVADVVERDADGEMYVRLLRLGALVAAGLVAYFGMLLILGFRPRDFARRAL